MQGLKPLLALKNFTGMGDNGVYWLDGFLPKSLQGQTILTRGHGVLSMIHTGTVTSGASESGFANLGQIIGMTGYAHINNNQVAALDSIGRIFDFNQSLANKLGQIHAIPTSGSILPCQLGGIFSTRLGNLLYTLQNHVGVAWVGQATGGSATTIIDTGRNFSDLGVSTSAGANKVYNLTRGAESTIGSITTTTNANDTLNVTGFTTQAGDWYVVFVDTRFSFGTSDANDLHFETQPNPKYWNRQPFLWNDAYYFLNGNYIAKLAAPSVGTAEEATWTSDTLDEFHKQLPTNHQGLMAEYNQDRLLIASYVNRRGALLLWDGYSSNWLSILELEMPVSGMVRYQSGWLVLIGASVYYTDGYTIQYVNKLPDSIDTDSIVAKKSNMVATEDGFIISWNRGSVTDRLVDGNYAYNMRDNSWSYFPLVDTNGDPHQSGCSLFSVNTYDATFTRVTPRVFCCGTEIGRVVSQSAKKSSVLLYIKLPQKMNLNLIELNLAPKNDAAPTSTSQSAVVRVNYGQGLHQLFSTVYPATGTTVSALKNALGASMKTRVGQELLVTAGNIGYERTYISSIADPGTADEVITVSPVLSAVPSSTMTPIRVLDLVKAGAKTITSDAFPSELVYNIPHFYSDRLWLEIVFESQDTFPLDLHAINVF